MLRKWWLIALIFVSWFAVAEPTTPDLKIGSIRVYTNGDIFLHMKSRSLCDTEVYVIPAGSAAREEMYSLMLAAYMADASVRLEIVNSGCTGWGTQLQSVYIVK